MVDGEFDKYLVSFMGSLGIAQILDDTIRRALGIPHTDHPKVNGRVRSLNRNPAARAVGIRVAADRRGTPGLLAITDQDHGSDRTAGHPVPGLT